MRSNTQSRRRWLMSALVLCASPALSDEPIDSGGTKTRVKANFLPMRSRLIQFSPKLPDQKQTVVTAIASDPKGDFVAVAGDDHTIRVISTQDLRVVKYLTAHRDLIKTLTFDRSGEKMASAGNDGQLIVWDCQNDFNMLQRLGGAPALACVRFSPDGNEMAAVGFDRTVYVIGRGNKKRPMFRCDCNDLRAVAYRDDNEQVAVAGRSGNLHLFSAATGELIGEFEAHRGRVHAMEYLRDSNLLVSVAEDGAVIVFDTRANKILKRTQTTTGKLFAMSIVDSERVAVAGSDNIIRIVNTSNGKSISALTGHKGSIPTLCAAGDNLFSGGYDATLRRWNLTAIRNEERIAEGKETIDR